jgi:hypothetical protein
MYPQLINQASRLAPMLSRVLARGGSFASPFWKTQQIDTPDVNAQPMPPKAPDTGPHPPISGPQNINFPQAPQAPSVPISTDNSAAPAPAAALGNPFLPPWMTGAQWKAPAAAPTAAPAAPQTASAPIAPAGVPLPQARPAEAPQVPSDNTGFFMRNALMMQDPNGGGFIDPTGAASVSGPDLISKMMAYLHQKA